MDEGRAELGNEQENVAWADEAFTNRPEPDGSPSVDQITNWLKEEGLPEVEINRREDKKDRKQELSGQELALWRKVTTYYGGPEVKEGKANWSLALEAGLRKRYGFKWRWKTTITDDGYLQYDLKR